MQLTTSTGLDLDPLVDEVQAWFDAHNKGNAYLEMNDHLQSLLDSYQAHADKHPDDVSGQVSYIC